MVQLLSIALCDCVLYCSSEPWVVASRVNVPWYDELYRGFGYNKIQNLHHINHEGFTFHVMHDGYLIHRCAYYHAVSIIKYSVL